MQASQLGMTGQEVSSSSGDQMEHLAMLESAARSQNYGAQPIQNITTQMIITGLKNYCRVCLLTARRRWTR